MSIQNDRESEVGMVFDLRNTDSLDLFARVLAVLQCHQVEISIVKEGQWATIIVGGAK